MNSLKLTEIPWKKITKLSKANYYSEFFEEIKKELNKVWQRVKEIINSCGAIMVSNDLWNIMSLNTSLQDFYMVKRYEQDCVYSKDHIHGFSVYTKLPAHNTHHLFKSRIQDSKQ